MFKTDKSSNSEEMYPELKAFAGFLTFKEF